MSPHAAALMHQAPAGTRESDRSAVTVDGDDLPVGVTCAGQERWPDLTRPLVTDTPVETQLPELHASSLVGALDVARFQPVDAPAARAAEHPPFRWIATTHAASQAERLAWVPSLHRATTD